MAINYTGKGASLVSGIKIKKHKTTKTMAQDAIDTRAAIELMMDPVNHPKHYAFGIEIIDAIESWGLGFHLGTVGKDVSRAAHKGNELEDLRKASWYLSRQIKILELEKQNENT